MIGPTALWVFSNGFSPTVCATDDKCALFFRWFEGLDGALTALRAVHEIVDISGFAGNAESDCRNSFVSLIGADLKLTRRESDYFTGFDIYLFGFHFERGCSCLDIE